MGEIGELKIWNNSSFLIVEVFYFSK